MGELLTEKAQSRCLGTDCPECAAARRHYKETGCLDANCARDHRPLSFRPPPRREATVADLLYAEVDGTNCTIAGQHGTVTAIVRDPGLVRTVRAAFVHLDAGGMLYVTLGAASGDRDQWHEVKSSRRIGREEFDRLNALDRLRRDMGWRDEAATRCKDCGGEPASGWASTDNWHDSGLCPTCLYGPPLSLPPATEADR